MGVSKPVKGWFSTPGRPGDRTLQDQLKGLDRLLDNCHGKSILDIGCAEGLISLELAKLGATVHGVEIVADHVKTAKSMQADLPVCFEVGDANTWAPKRQYDIVIMLALLHKLKNPTAAAARFVDAAREMVVLRMPPKYAPVIIDPRSNNNPHDIGVVLAKRDFGLVQVARGHFDEWVGYYLHKSLRVADVKFPCMEPS